MQEHIAGVLLVVISLLLIVFPNVVWKITESWKSSESESPSNAYIVTVRCVGLVLLVTGVVVFI